MNKVSLLTPQDFIDFEEGVLNFNKCMGNVVGTREENKKLINTYQKLSYEECFGEGELLDSVEKGDLEGELDGLIDCVFTVFYWNNLTHPKRFLSQELTWLRNLSTAEDVGVCYDTLSESIGEEDAMNSQTELIHLLFDAQNKFDIRGAFKEILSSNMSKFAVKGEINIEEEKTYIEGKGRYFDITTEEVNVGGKTYIAFKAGKDLQNNVTFVSPKLIKCSTFVEPELKQFIYKGEK